MSLVLSGERPSAAATSTPLQFVAVAVAKFQAGIRQQVALRSLLALDDNRLEDLGINRGDLFDAMLAGRPTRLLEERRRARAYDVLNP